LLQDFCDFGKLSVADQAMVVLRRAASFPSLIEGFTGLAVAQLGTRVGTGWPCRALFRTVLLSGSLPGRDVRQLSTARPEMSQM
jgi:hypothetical protein